MGRVERKDEIYHLKNQNTELASISLHISLQKAAWITCHFDCRWSKELLSISDRGGSLGHILLQRMKNIQNLFLQRKKSFSFSLHYTSCYEIVLTFQLNWLAQISFWLWLMYFVCIKCPAVTLLGQRPHGTTMHNNRVKCKDTYQTQSAPVCK